MPRSSFLHRWLLVIVALVVPLSTAAAQGESFRDGFDNAALPGWERPPEVSAVDGVLRVPPGAFAVRFGEWSEGTLSVRLKVPVESAAVVAYAFRDSGSYHLSISNEAIVLLRVGGESDQPLGSAPLSGWAADGWVDVQVTWLGGEHRVSVDGTEVLHASESEPLTGGGILLRADGASTVEFDEVAMDLQAGPTVPSGPTPAEGTLPPSGEDRAPTEGPLPVASLLTPTPTPAPSGLSGLLGQFSTQRADPLQLSTVAINLALAALFAFLLGRAYIHWGASLSNRRAFASNFMLITVTTTFIILVVRSSVALSLGLVGALSIVRFRAAIKEPEELSYLFFAIGIGIGLGDNQRLLTALAMMAGLILIGLMNLFRRSQADVNLHLTVAGSGEARVELDRLLETLKGHCTKLRLMRFDENGERMETSFLVELRRLSDLQAARNDLRQLAPGLEITFLDNRGVG